jgi:hypothetical protein
VPGRSHGLLGLLTVIRRSPWGAPQLPQALPAYRDKHAGGVAPGRLARGFGPHTGKNPQVGGPETTRPQVLPAYREKLAGGGPRDDPAEGLARIPGKTLGWGGPETTRPQVWPAYRAKLSGEVA